MSGWKRWTGIGIALGLVLGLVPLLQKEPIEPLQLPAPLGKLAEREGIFRARPDLEGLDLRRFKYHPRKVTSPLRHGRSAELTLDPELQRSALSVMQRYSLPEAGAVLMDTRTAEVLVYASHVQEGVPFDVNSRSEAPAASVFKLVTGAALLENPAINAHTEQCYRGGRSRIVASELEEDPKRDRWCASLAMAMGRSINVVFARLARKHLTPESLTQTAGGFGFGAPVPFDVSNEAPKIDIPADPLEFARAAAGFWHTSLSPLAGASLVQAIANGGVALRPRIVRQVFDPEQAEPVWTADSEPQVLRRAVSPRAARELTQMMVQTVASGSAFKSFHDRKRRPFLPNIHVAGKTGTLTRHKENRHYTWFVGFAPADSPEVAVAALIVNTPVWRIKAPLLAREVLRAYFAKRGYSGVSRP